MTYSTATKRRASSPHETIAELDRDILKMLARRAHLLGKLRDRKGHLDPRAEKELRASWEKYATRMSHDTRLIRQMFSLLQEVTFMPRPAEGEERRPAFTLAPMRKPVNVSLPAPLAGRRARLYLTLAAVSGSACRISPSLLGDAEVECIKMFNQAGTSLAWDEDGTLRAREGGGLTLADKVIYVGDDILNFHLILGQYVGNPSRAKFIGESTLKLADFSALRRFLPQLGVRLTNAVPKSDGLPVRVECSGVLPDVVTIPADLPADAVTGLLMGVPFWEREVAFDLASHPEAPAIAEEALSILKDCGGQVSATESLIRITPGGVKTPLAPLLGMDMRLAAPLLALPAATHGRVRLAGMWPSCPVGDTLRTLLAQAGVDTVCETDSITATRSSNNTSTQGPLDAATLPPHFAPLALALASLPALAERAGRMPRLPAGTDFDEVERFLAHVGLEADHNGTLRRAPHEAEATAQPWTASSPAWAMALALTAYARPGLTLTNPGIMTELYPAFWNLYNALPCPEFKKTVAEPIAEPIHAKPVRRRILATGTSGTGSGDIPH